jgi:hypothetical protein
VAATTPAGPEELRDRFPTLGEPLLALGQVAGAAEDAAAQTVVAPREDKPQPQVVAEQEKIPMESGTFVSLISENPARRLKWRA